MWAPVVLALAIICAESTNTFSSQNTSSILRPILEHWFGPIRDSSWDLYHHYLRKTGHFIGYGLVAFTFLRAWLHTLDLSKMKQGYGTPQINRGIREKPLAIGGKGFEHGVGTVSYTHLDVYKRQR